MTDPIATLEFLFAGATRVTCLKAADVNDDGNVDIADPVAALSYIFGAGPPLPAPFEVCGYDPTLDGLSCESFPVCPSAE